jgi:hypothetical protein
MKILNVSTNNDLANEVGPLKYIAKLTGKSLDQVVNWFIIALMLVFDPLAIALVVAANFVFSYISKDKTEPKKEEKSEDPKEPEVEETADEEVEEAVEEVNEVTKEETTIKPTIFMIGDTPIKSVEDSIDYFSEDYIKNEPLSNSTEPEEAEDEVKISEPVNDDYEYDVFSPDFTYDEIYPTDFTEDEIVAEEEIQEEVIKEEEIQEEVIKDAEDGEFGGYKLGNVYNSKRSTNIKDYKDRKDTPLEILFTKGDPTRL